MADLDPRTSADAGRPVPNRRRVAATAATTTKSATTTAATTAAATAADATAADATARFPRSGDVLALASGIVWALCWMTPLLAPLIPLWFVLLNLALERVRNGRHALRVGALSGIAQYLVGAHFLLALTAFSPLGVVIYLIAVVYIVPFSAGAAWLAHRLERRTGVPRQVAFALLFPIFERGHAASPASLPADLIAHAFGGRPTWLAFSAWTGPFGVALWSALVALLLWSALRVRRLRPAAAAAALAGAALLWSVPLGASWLVGAGAGVRDRAAAGAGAAARSDDGAAAGNGDGAAAAAAAAQGVPFKVAIVQPSLTLTQKLEPEHANVAWARLEELTLRAPRDVDLIVWGETLRPGPIAFREGAPFHDEKVERIAAAAGVPILYGAVLARVDDTGLGFDGLFNGAALARPDGSPGAWYGKQQLVPFVEGLPFASLIGYRPHVTPGKKRSWITLMGNFSPGPELTIFEVGPARIGALICYEGLYPGYAREYRDAGANLLAVLVNDAWWGRTFFSPWHARMLAARAVENAVPVVRAGNSGVSCAMNADGVMTGRADKFEVTTLVAEVNLATGGGTTYSRRGDWILAVLPLGFLLAWFATSRLAGRRGA
jgi:apolipoprotein N-acyltransferase